MDSLLGRTMMLNGPWAKVVIASINGCTSSRAGAHSTASAEARTNRDAEILEESFKNIGAVVMGRRMFNLGERYWSDNPPFHNPVFIVTHHAQDKKSKDGGTTYTFITEGIESALKQAKAAAADKDVSVAGGANIVQQFLKAGFLDEIQIHLAPVLLGEGRRLLDHLGTEHIELESTRVIESPAVIHLRFRVAK